MTVSDFAPELKAWKQPTKGHDLLHPLRTSESPTPSKDFAKKLTDTLKNYHKELYEEVFSTVERLKTAGLARDPEDNQFLIDNPNAFLFGVIFDQQIRAERAWSAPHELYKR